MARAVEGFTAGLAGFACGAGSRGAIAAAGCTAAGFTAAGSTAEGAGAAIASDRASAPNTTDAAGWVAA